VSPATLSNQCGGIEDVPWEGEGEGDVLAAGWEAKRVRIGAGDAGSRDSSGDLFVPYSCVKQVGLCAAYWASCVCWVVRLWAQRI
jgi:hypothetical protein